MAIRNKINGEKVYSTKAEAIFLQNRQKKQSILLSIDISTKYFIIKIVYNIIIKYFL